MDWSGKEQEVSMVDILLLQNAPTWFSLDKLKSDVILLNNIKEMVSYNLKIWYLQWIFN